jgi:hypothetical protein
MKTDLQLVFKYPIADVRRGRRPISFCSRDELVPEISKMFSGWSRDVPTPPRPPQEGCVGLPLWGYRSSMWQFNLKI